VTRKELLKLVARVDVYVAIVSTLTLLAVLVMLVWVGILL